MVAFLAGLDAGIGKAEEFAAACKEAGDAADRMALAADESAAAVAAAMGGATESVEKLAVAMKALDDKHVEVTASVSGISGPVAGAVAQIEALKAAMGGLGNVTVKVNADVDGTGKAAAAAAGGMRLWGTGIRLTGTALHWIIAGTAELAAVLVPATVAAAAWAFVWVQGATNVYTHLHALFTATEATGQAAGQTYGEMLGLKGAFQAAQNAANPDVYEALGAALNVVKETSGGLANTGLELGRIFDTFLAKLVYDFSAAGGGAEQLHGLLSAMIPDLVEFGQIFGNLGHFIATFAAQMPGLAMVLLKVLDAVTEIAKGVVDFTNSFRIFGVSILTVVMGFEEFNRWGSLLVSLFARMGLASVAVTGGFLSMERAGLVLKNLFMVVPNLIFALITNLGVLIGTMGAADGAMAGMGRGMLAFAASAREAMLALEPWQIALIALAAVGIGILIDKMLTARSAVQEFADSLQAATEKAKDLNVLNVIASNMTKLSTATDQAATSTSRMSNYMAASEMLHGTYVAAENKATSAVQVLTAAQRQQAQDQQNVLAGVGYLTRAYGTSFVGALNMAQQAGVKLQDGITGQGRAADIARLKIADYMAGMNAMGESESAVGRDTTLLGIAAGVAGTKVSQLNQAIDGFVTGITGGTAGLSQLIESFQNMGHVVGDTANHLAGITGGTTLTVNQFAKSLTSFAGNGAAAWSNFDTALSGSAEQMADWFRTAGAEGAATAPQLTKAMQDITAGFVNFAKDSPAAQKELVGFAQAQGLNISTFPQLVKSLKDAGAGEKSLQQITGDVTAKMANMNAVAQALGSSVGSALTSAMNAARVAASGLGQAAQSMATSWYHANIVNSSVISGFQGTFRALYAVDQNTQEAKAAADGYAQQLGLNATQIAYLNGFISKMTSQLGTAGHAAASAAAQMEASAAAARALAAAIAALQSKTIYIDVVQQGAGVNIPGGGGRRITGNAKGTGPGGAERGLSLVGEEGPELMWMRGGEHVLPAGPTAALMHAAGGAHGYAGGTSTFDKLLHLLERDFRLIENGLRVNLKRPQGVWFPSIIKLVEEIRRDFAKHLITQQQELALLKQAETRNKKLEGIATRHAESKDLTALADLFAPKHHAAHLLGPIAALIAQVEKAHGAGVIGKDKEGRLVRQLKHDNAKLLNLEHDRSKILTALHNAEAHYLAEVKAERQYAASVTSSAESSASLSTILGGATGPVSSSYLLASMRMDLSTITRFDSDIKKLEKLGLDKNLLNQIIQMGPAQGDPVAQALINGPLSNIKAMNATESHIAAASKKLGQSTSKEMYSAGIDAAKGLVKGIELEKKQIDKVMEQVARDMARTLRRELKAHSPSEVTRQIGRDVIDGIPLGVADRLPSLDSSLRSAAGHVPSALGSAAGVRGSGGGSMEITVPVTVMLDGKVLTRSVQTHSLRVDRRNGANNLSLRRGRGT